MQELWLQRSDDDRRRFDIDGVGWLRTSGWANPRATAGTGETTAPQWAFEPRGWAGRGAEAIDERSGLPIGGYRRTGTFADTGEITWGGRVHELARAGRWRRRGYQLRLDGTALLELDVKLYGDTPVALRLQAETDPGLVLFACWLGRLFVAQDAAAAT